MTAVRTTCCISLRGMTVYGNVRGMSGSDDTRADYYSTADEEELTESDRQAIIKFVVSRLDTIPDAMRSLPVSERVQFLLRHLRPWGHPNDIRLGSEADEAALIDSDKKLILVSILSQLSSLRDWEQGAPLHDRLALLLTRLKPTFGKDWGSA